MFILPTSLALAAAAALSGSSMAANPDKRAQVELVCEQTELVPGTTANLGVHFKLDPHWHVYWHGRSDAGSPIEVKLDLPPGYAAGATQWPAPKRLISEGDILDHIYEDAVTLIIPIKIPPAAAGKAAFSATVNYVICAGSCIMEDAKPTLTLPVAAAGTKASESKSAKLFQATRARLSKPLPTGDTAPTARREGRAAIFDAPGAKGLSFFPGSESPLLADFIATGHADKPRLSIKLDPDADPQAAIDGVLEVRYPDNRGAVWYDINMPPPGGPPPPPPPGPATKPNP